MLFIFIYSILGTKRNMGHVESIIYLNTSQITFCVSTSFVVRSLVDYERINKMGGRGYNCERFSSVLHIRQKWNRPKT